MNTELEWGRPGLVGTVLISFFFLISQKRETDTQKTMVLFECVINGQCKKIQRICNFFNEDKQKNVVLTSAHVPIFPVYGLGSYIIKNKNYHQKTMWFSRNYARVFSRI